MGIRLRNFSRQKAVKIIVFILAVVMITCAVIMYLSCILKEIEHGYIRSSGNFNMEGLTTKIKMNSHTIPLGGAMTTTST